jgi:uncharacterized damage-inducible protein DinB
MTQHTTLTQAIETLLAELVAGGTGEACYVLNPTDPGILRSLDRLSADDASTPTSAGGASIAAHVDHLCYGFELLNRFAAGENAFDTADYSASWRRRRVSQQEWSALRQRLREQITAWQAAVRHLDQEIPVHVTGAIASIVHLAYHLGAIRQINHAAAGPPAATGS